MRSGDLPHSWLFLDLNSYFASVEQQLRPELRGKPTAVVPLMAETTCAIAASYEARAFGIKTGTLVSEMRERCPFIQLVEARHEIYVEYHHAIVEAVESCVPVAAVMSIDEMACRLTGTQRQEKNAIALAQKIKSVIRKKVGETLRCSIGIAPNRFLAKVASDMQKPDGLTLIRPGDLPKILYSLQLRDFPGIGPRTEVRLKRQAIHTTQELCRASKAELRAIWGGIGGERFWGWLRGEDLPEPPTQHKSLSQSHVLSPKLRSQDGAYAVAQRLIHKASARLRKKSYWTSGFWISVRFQNGKSWEARAGLPECQDTLTLLCALQSLWRSCPRDKPFWVGITLSGLVQDQFHTLSLFGEPRGVRLSEAMDQINKKFGSETVYFGGIHSVLESAPTRIAFTQIPDLE